MVTALPSSSKRFFTDRARQMQACSAHWVARINQHWWLTW
ncbi:hypothetical protein PG5_30500 [Pseudomonas sp. G5(2012)]|nr:hypothetical protein PG5_30500 [Pseudomonas sp. G5(2012)]